MKYGEYKKNILIKLDEYNPNAATMTDDEDYALKFPYAFNEAVRYAFYGKNIKKIWNITQGESLNLLDVRTTEHRTNDVMFEADGAYGYYFEVNDTAEIKVYANDSIVDTIKHTAQTDQTGFAAYKGIAGGGNKLKLEFCGEYFYKIKNVCLYNVRFSSVSRMPNYSGYCEHDIPSGLHKVENVYLCEDGVKRPESFRIIGGKLILPDKAGEYEIESTFFPDSVTDETPNDTEIEVPIDVQFVIINKTCALLTQEDDSQDFLAVAEQGMQNIEQNQGKPGPVVVRRW